MRTACKAADLTKKIIYEICGGNPADEIINVSSLMHDHLVTMGSSRIASSIEPLLIVHKQPTYKDEY
jgi:hypothetical protein